MQKTTKRKMKSETYTLNIYNAVDLLIMLAEKEDTDFEKNELADIVKSIDKKTSV